MIENTNRAVSIQQFIGKSASQKFIFGFMVKWLHLVVPLHYSGAFYFYSESSESPVVSTSDKLLIKKCSKP